VSKQKYTTIFQHQNTETLKERVAHRTLGLVNSGDRIQLIALLNSGNLKFYTYLLSSDKKLKLQIVIGSLCRDE
jgi:hypothetical protein